MTLPVRYPFRAFDCFCKKTRNGAWAAFLQTSRIVWDKDGCQKPIVAGWKLRAETPGQAVSSNKLTGRTLSRQFLRYIRSGCGTQNVCGHYDTISERKTATFKKYCIKLRPLKKKVKKKKKIYRI